MFPLSRPFRQGIATALLVLCTVVPTVLTAFHAWRIHRPGHLRDVEIELGRELGLQVTLEGVRYPRPGEMQFLGIVLRHAEPRGKGLTEIVRAGLVRVVRGDRELTLQADGLRLSGESPRQALELVGSMVQRSGSLRYDRINMTAQTCDVDLGRDVRVFSLQNVAGEFVASQSSPTLRLAYRLTESGGGTHCELTLNRDRSAAPARTSLLLRTLEGPPLPAGVLDVFFDSESWLGDRARFEGALALRQAGAGPWEIDLEGSLIDVDLSTLVERRFPRHHLSGLARITLRSARWTDRPGQGPGWSAASGELLAGNGTIGAGLLNALAREMNFRLSPRVARSDPRRPDVDFRALGVAFEMRPNGEIHLAGALGTEFSPDTILASVSAPLAFAPSGTASVHGLIKTLFPLADSPPGILIPLSQESSVLLCLPVPPEVASRPGRKLDGN